MVLGDILSRLSQTDFGNLEFTSISQPLGLLDTREALTSDEQNRLALDTLTTVRWQAIFRTLET